MAEPLCKTVEQPFAKLKISKHRPRNSWPSCQPKAETSYTKMFIAVLRMISKAKRSKCLSLMAGLAKHELFTQCKIRKEQGHRTLMHASTSEELC